MVKINEVGMKRRKKKQDQIYECMLESDFRMAKITFVMFKITPEHTLNNSKSIKCMILHFLAHFSYY